MKKHFKYDRVSYQRGYTWKENASAENPLNFKNLLLSRVAIMRANNSIIGT